MPAGREKQRLSWRQAFFFFFCRVAGLIIDSSGSPHPANWIRARPAGGEEGAPQPHCWIRGTRGCAVRAGTGALKTCKCWKVSLDIFSHRIVGLRSLL